jgi:hypothetical protein
MNECNTCSTTCGTGTLMNRPAGASIVDIEDMISGFYSSNPGRRIARTKDTRHRR